MEERGVTVDGTTHALPRPFTVLRHAESRGAQGDVPLPEAQVDRFCSACAWGTREPRTRRSCSSGSAGGDPLAGGARRRDRGRPAAVRAAVRAVHVSGRRRRLHRWRSRRRQRRDACSCGSARARAPRSALQHAAQAAAALAGRDFVTPDDVQELVAPVLAHRIVAGAHRDASRRRRWPLGVLRDAHLAGPSRRRKRAAARRTALAATAPGTRHARLRTRSARSCA